MVNHPNRKVSPQRTAFIKAALAQDGKVFRSSGLTQARYWKAGDVVLKDSSGEVLWRDRLLEPVKQPLGGNTMRWGGGYLYRLTDAGRALASST